MFASSSPVATFYGQTNRHRLFPSLSRRPFSTSFACKDLFFSSKISPLCIKDQSTASSDEFLYSDFSSYKRCASESKHEELKQSIFRKVVLPVLVCKALAFVSFVTCGACLAATGDAIKASGLGLKVATALRGSGWADEAIVFALATLPVLELRGAIPVGYWMQLDPLKLTILSVLGNMVPVPFIVLYLKKFAAFIAQKSLIGTRAMEFLFETAREKAGPVEEFQWLGLMLFVAVPFPGTGAWTGAIIASILDMPFWSAFSANFLGVVLAGLLVNLLMNLGMKYAILTGLLLFVLSSVMWGVLRSFKKSLNAK